MQTKTRTKIRDNIILLLIAVASVVIRLLMEYEFHNSSLLYIGVPFLIAMALLWIDREDDTGSWRRDLFNHLIRSLIVMLGSSVILFEGFLCVAMFMPIYLLVILIVFGYKWLLEHYKKSKGSQLSSHLIPVILVLSAFEGTHNSVTMPRENIVSVTRVIDATPAQIKKQFVTKPRFEVPDNWFLSLFPMPYDVKIQGIEPGDIHEAHFRYHRWFVTNTHDGSMKIQIAQSNENVILTRVIGNTSYLSNYMRFNQFRVELNPQPDGRTAVTLSIEYERLLDPAWYFQPMQRYAVTKAVEYTIEHMLTPHE